MPQTLHYTIPEVEPYINWAYFFHAWGFPARFTSIAQIHGCDACRATWLAGFPVEERARAAEAMQLHKEAQRMLHHLATLPTRHPFRIHVRFGIYECNGADEDIIIYLPSSTARLALLRQQGGDCLCLSDFVRPVNDEGSRDNIGIFAAAADEAIEQSFPEDPYRHLLCQTLADRLAEAAVERAHQAIRRHYWGYAPDEDLAIADLHAERFRGIRPAVGYPSLPDQSLNFDLDAILGFAEVGIRLTSSGAMQPHAAVSGLMLAHPQARYFDVGHIGEDQLKNYARRRNISPERLASFLGRSF